MSNAILGNNLNKPPTAFTCRVIKVSTVLALYWSGRKNSKLGRNDRNSYHLQTQGTGEVLKLILEKHLAQTVEWWNSNHFNTRAYERNDLNHFIVMSLAS